MKLKYRVKAHYPINGITLVAPVPSWDDAEKILDELIDSGIATGGHIEEHVDGIGWVLCDEPEVLETTKEIRHG